DRERAAKSQRQEADRRCEFPEAGPCGRRRIALSRLALALVLFSVLWAVRPSIAHAQEFATRREAVRVTTITTGLDHPWGLAFLPDGRKLVTERSGQLRIVEADGRLSAPLGNVPAVYARGQGGLLDVALDPQFEQNRTVYLSYAEPGDGGASTAVARARLA